MHALKSLQADTQTLIDYNSKVFIEGRGRAKYAYLELMASLGPTEADLPSSRWDLNPATWKKGDEEVRRAYQASKTCPGESPRPTCRNQVALILRTYQQYGQSRLFGSLT